MGIVYENAGTTSQLRDCHGFSELELLDVLGGKNDVESISRLFKTIVWKNPRSKSFFRWKVMAGRWYYTVHGNAVILDLTFQRKKLFERGFFPNMVLTRLKNDSTSFFPSKNVKKSSLEGNMWFSYKRKASGRRPDQRQWVKSYS